MRSLKAKANVNHHQKVIEECINKENSISRPNSVYQGTPFNNFRIPDEPNKIKPSIILNNANNGSNITGNTREIINRKYFSIKDLKNIESKQDETDILKRPPTSNSSQGQQLTKYLIPKKDYFELKGKKECDEVAQANCQYSTTGKSPFVSRNIDGKRNAI